MTENIFSWQRRGRGCLMGLVPLLLAFLILSSNSNAFTVPEKLVYDLTWTGIKAGTATQEIREEGGALRIVSTARSEGLVNVFFPVNDRIETLLSKGNDCPIGLPRSYRMKISEGHRRRDKEILFDHEQGKARFIDHMDGEETSVDIGDKTCDTYSSFYFVRTMPLEVGKSVFVSVLDNQKLWNVEVQVLRKEKLRTRLGQFNTIVVRPMIKSDGIFDGKGAIYIWLTDDERRLPVKMQTKVAVGSVTATLVSAN